MPDPVRYIIPPIADLNRQQNIPLQGEPDAWHQVLLSCLMVMCYWLQSDDVPTFALSLTGTPLPVSTDPCLITAASTLGHCVRVICLQDWLNYLPCLQDTPTFRVYPVFAGLHGYLPKPNPVLRWQVNPF